MWDVAEANTYKSLTVTSKEGETLSRLIRRFRDPIHPDHLELYRDWLCNHSPQRTAWSEEMIPLGRGAYLEEGLKFPFPTGHNWRVMLEQFDVRP
jgi:hypothetical protein